MPYAPNIINNNQPNYQELDEAVAQTIQTVVSGSTSGDLGNKALVDLAFTPTNLTNQKNLTTTLQALISIWRDNQNLNNRVPTYETTYASQLYSVAYNLYVRVSADRNNIAYMDRVCQELINALVLNQYDNQMTLALVGSNQYQIRLDKNKLLGLPIRNLEPFGGNTTFITSIITILFHIKKTN
jgi:hypothetical protein